MFKVQVHHIFLRALVEKFCKEIGWIEVLNIEKHVLIEV